MKNTVKFLSMMFAVSAMMLVSCTPEPDEPDTPAEPTKYTVQVNCNDATMGTVTIAPQQTTYLEGDTIVITATPNEGNKFLNWNGSITDNPYTYVVKENITFTANFEALPQPTYSATFNGTAVDMSGWYSADCLPDGSVWLFQCAIQAEPNADGGMSVHFPFLALWMTGNSANNLTVDNNRTEFYYARYYTYGENDYSDYQFMSMDNINCTQLDLTTYTMSMTTSCTFYECGPMINGTAQYPEECPTGTLALTMNNMTYTPVESKGMLNKKASFNR